MLLLQHYPNRRSSRNLRNRRISTNSIHAHRNGKALPVPEDGSPEPKSKRANPSRVSFAAGGVHASASSPKRPVGSAPTIRQSRPRTLSATSSASSHFINPTVSATGSSTIPVVPFSMLRPDNSQMSLEKIIKSRLVETFLSIDIPLPTPITTTNSPPALPPRPHTLHRAPSSQSHNPLITPHSTRKPNDSPIPRKPKKTSVTAPQNTSRRESSASLNPIPTKMASNHTKSPSLPPLRGAGRTQQTPPLKSLHHTAPTPSKLPNVPNYLSPIHQPSTNPVFAIDARARYDLASWTDTSGCKLKIEIWGKIDEEQPPNGKLKGKGKEKESDVVELEGNSNVEWKVLDTWEINLSDLVALPEDVAANPYELPSNTLLITLSPPGQTFYLPSKMPRSRSTTPSPGYTSDPESGAREIKHQLTPLASSTVSRRRNRRGPNLESPAHLAQTASWQDILKLVTRQSYIYDNQTSLSQIVDEINKVLEEDQVAVLKREISEREARHETLISDYRNIARQAESFRQQIASCREEIRLRKENLELARQQYEANLLRNTLIEESVTQERIQHQTLRARLNPTRITLLSILSNIFPIDLLSPPDLLYTILDVPLPIPLTPTDPAPPLTLPSHKDVVQLLAAYLGKGLIYPVTCVGSRSLIRDGISAMVGPRMFPLFSRGVDTYRFEYGVFLLNKDIEMLMADRDLQALDMRHTLPNLKNLLLTLTNGDGAKLQPIRPSESPLSRISSLESQSYDEILSETNASTPKATNNTELPKDTHTPPESGSITPVAATDQSKKSRPFLDLAPFAGFLLTRYPSSKSSAPGGDDVCEDEDEDDRHTIHGVPRETPIALNQEGKHPNEVVSANDVDSGGKPEPDHPEKHEDGKNISTTSYNHPLRTLTNPPTPVES
ncbi:hypothetical protein BD779DRAFT_1526053 [Infundibulicybe gibba]|nr:hypothetical protein BD779DRAFT_1526053 [Infundibulicybe gibba]